MSSAPPLARRVGGSSRASPNFVAPEKSVGRVREFRTGLYGWAARAGRPLLPSTDSFPHANAIHLIHAFIYMPTQ